MPDSLLDGNLQKAAASGQTVASIAPLPKPAQAASFDFESHTRSVLLSMAPEDDRDVAIAKLKSASASLFLGRASQAIASGRFTDMQPHMDAVLERRGEVALPLLQKELCGLRSIHPERGSEERISQRAKALFGLICAAKICHCT